MKNKIYRIEDFTLNTLNRQFLYKNIDVQISSRAFDILLYLIERKGNIVDKDELLEKVWADSFVEESNLAVHISAVRRILQEKRGEYKYIKTISGRGYSFIAPVMELDSAPVFPPPSPQEEASAEKHSIAVLPFTFEKDNQDFEYLANGITQSLISDLSQISTLKVLAYSAVRNFRNSDVEIQEIGFLLGANKILAGHISEYKDKLEISVELVNASDKAFIWGTQQSFKFDDVFRFKKEISLSIAENLKLKLTKSDKKDFAKQQELDSEAHKLYFRGKFILESRTTKKDPKDILLQALNFFQQATKIEPNYALAYVGIGSVYVSLHNHNLLNREKAYAEAQRALKRAIDIDERLSEAYVLKGSIELMFEKEFARAEKSLNKAIELNPNNPDAYHWKGLFSLCMERHKEAFDLETKATQLDPTSIRFNEQLIRIFFNSGDFNKAIVQAEEILEFDEKCLASHLFLAFSYSQLGSFDCAFRHIDKALEIRKQADIILTKAYIYGLSGNTVEAEKILRQVFNRCPASEIDFTDVAAVYLALNEIEKVYENLNKAIADNSASSSFLKTDIRFKSLRNDKRFEELLRKLNLL